MCVTRGSSVVTSAYDMLEMSVVRGVRGVGGVWEMCVYGSGGVVGVVVERMGLDFNNPVGIGGVWGVSVFGLRCCWRGVCGLGQCLEG